MAMSSSSKSPGRTPPFVLVALVLIVVILGYNYWVMSSSNRSLHDMNDKLAIETKDTAEKRLSAEKSLESAREELRILQGNLAQVKKSLEDKDAELNNIRADLNRVNDENNNCKQSMAKCDEDLQTEKKSFENVSAIKTKLETDLATALTKTCSPDACDKPVKDILVLSAKLVGTEKMTQALTEAKLDANKLMEGIEKIEPPQVNTAPTEKVMDSPATTPSNNSYTALPTVHAASQNASENLAFESDKMVGGEKEMNSDKKEIPDVKDGKPESILSTEANSVGDELKEPVAM